MDRIKKNKLAVAVAGLLALLGLGTGVAAGSHGSARPATVRVQPAAQTSVIPPVDTPASSGGQPAPTAEQPEPAGPDNDNIQEGDQNAPDGANEANEKEGTEQEGPENPSDDRGPGQAGSQNQNVPAQGVR